MDTIENDPGAAGVNEGDVENRDKWRPRIRVWPTPNSWEEGEREFEEESN